MSISNITFHIKIIFKYFNVENDYPQAICVNNDLIMQISNR